jgi:hypothetical protein
MKAYLVNKTLAPKRLVLSGQVLGQDQETLSMKVERESVAEWGFLVPTNIYQLEFEEEETKKRTFTDIVVNSFSVEALDELNFLLILLYSPLVG